MARLRFTTGTRYLLEGQVYVVRQPLPDDRLLVENQSFSGQVQVAQDELYAAWAEGKLRFEVPGNRAKQDLDSPIATEYTITDFTSLPTHVRDEAWRRYQLILPLLKLSPKERSRQAITEYAEQVRQKLYESLDEPNQAVAQRRLAEGKRAGIGQSATRASIERWLHAFTRSGYDIRALVPSLHESGGKGTPRVDSDVERIMNAVIQEYALRPHYRTVGDVVAEVANRIADENRFRPAPTKLQPPGKTTVYRRIQTMGARALLQRAPTRSEQQAQRLSMPGPQLTRPLERVEIDHTILDLFLVDDEDRLPIGRPTLTYALDVYTGMPFGFYVGFEDPSYLTVMNCLLYGILPKPGVQGQYGTAHGWPMFGLPETLVIDNGKEFIGRDLDDACAQLGITLQRTPVRTPWFKGAVERKFKTLNTGLVHKLPGTTFSNIAKRGEYDPMRHSCITLSAFYEILHIFLLDEYAQKWQEGRGSTPARLWQESVQGGFTPTLHTNVGEVRILLGRTEERTVQRTGVDFEALRYQSPELVRIRSVLPQGSKVRIKYDPSDISTIHVYDPTPSQIGGSRWLRIPAIAQEYTDGLSLWKHRLLRGYVLARKHEVNEQALLDAKAHWQAVVVREFVTTKKARGRKQTARYLDLSAAGQPGAHITNKPAASALPQPTSATTLATGGESSAAATPTPKVRRTGRTKPPAQPAPTAPIAPEPEDDDFLADEEGWGSDYNLPHHGPQRIIPQVGSRNSLYANDKNEHARSQE